MLRFALFNLPFEIEIQAMLWYSVMKQYCLFLITEDARMTFNYNKLWKMLIDKNMMKTDLIREARISTNSMARIGKNEDVRLETLAKIAMALDCKLDDLVDYTADDKESN